MLAQTPSAVEALTSRRLAVGRPWLVLGKGPTARYASERLLKLHNVLSLNHACRIVPPAHLAAAHFVDVETFWGCLPLLTAATPVLMPWRPHRDFLPGDLTAEMLLAQARDRGWPGQIFAYNAEIHPKNLRHPALPTVLLRAFSATAAFDLLGLAGARKLRSIGVDGGQGYAPEFSDLQPLTNGRTSFEPQMQHLRAIVARHGMTWRRLGRDGRAYGTNGRLLGISCLS